MPKIINAYADPGGSLASSLTSLAQSIFGNQAQQEFIRQKALGSIRENTNIPLLADAVVAGDTAAATRYGILSGQDPKFTGGYHQFRVVNQHGPASEAATRATMSVPGANYGNTVQGTREDLTNRRVIAQMQAERAARAQQTIADTTPVPVIEEGVPVFRPRSQAVQGATPVLGLDQQRGTMLFNLTPSLSPDDQRRAVGIDKNPGTLWVYQTPDGQQGTTADGQRDVQSGAPLPSGTRVMKLEGPNAEGLTGNNPLDRQVADSRITTAQTVARIDRLTESLSQPNADQSVGFLGSVARAYNDVRAQTEATVRLFRGENAQQAFSSPEAKSAVDNAVTSIFENPAINQKAAQLGLSSAVIRSQIQDLAYMIAKSNDPSGRVSNQDVQNASAQVGAMIMDPKIAIQVLGDLKQRIVEGQEIRERVLKEMYPQLRTSTPGTGAPTAGTPNPAGQPTQRIKIDANGNVIQ